MVPMHRAWYRRFLEVLGWIMAAAVIISGVVWMVNQLG
jgi:hypothetical protein